MNSRSPVTVLLTVLAYVVATFGVQGTSHFLINADHYAAISIMRAEPVVPMGIASMIIQGLIFAYLFPAFIMPKHPIKSAIVFSWAIGGFLASYVALGEAGKYSIPSIPSWMVVEVSAAFVQFTLFGTLLGLLHRRAALAPATQPA
jgi:hypothetical protein